jgi:hypothetical protein
LVPMQYQYVTRIGSIRRTDGRVYVTLVEDQPGDEPGTTIAVVVAKIMMDLDKWETAVLETTEVLAEVRQSRRARGN